MVVLFSYNSPPNSYLSNAYYTENEKGRAESGDNKKRMKKQILVEVRGGCISSRHLTAFTTLLV